MKLLTQTLSRRRSLVTIAALACTAVVSAQAAGSPLRIGLAPFLSPTALLRAFHELRVHLESSLDRPVEMLTARDFRTLVEATMLNEYDVVLLPAHVARLALTDWRYELLAGTVEAVTVQVLVKDGGPIRTPADLKGQRAGMLDSLSLTATVGTKWLQDQALAADVKVLTMPSLDSALFALDNGDVAMVVTGTSQLLVLPQNTPRSARVLATIRDIPGPIYVARPGLPAGEPAAIRAAMASFRPNPTQATTARNSLLRPVSPDALNALDPFVAIARKALAAPR